MKNAAYVIPNADSFLVVENHGKNSDGHDDIQVVVRKYFKTEIAAQKAADKYNAACNNL